MAAETGIQWCDGTVNPVAGCDGCELFEPRAKTYARYVQAVDGDKTEAKSAVRAITDRFTEYPPLKASNLVLDAMIERDLVDQAKAQQLRDETKGKFKCYAAVLCEMRNSKPGWPDRFDSPKKFPGRMVKSAALPDLLGTAREDKPWLNGQPRLIFVSDMGDALSADIDFNYLEEEIISHVTSEKGRRHVWLWVTKRPKQMAKFAKWLQEKGGAWPDNLVPMTTVTSQETAYRVDDLREVPSKMRGLSIEPLWGRLTLDLTGIDWVIVGGESGPSAETFQMEWSLNLYEQCKAAGVKFFLKQLGADPSFQGESITVKDPHGGEWDEWPEGSWKVREMPEFQTLVPAASEKVDLVPITTEEDESYRAEREALVATGIRAGLVAAKALCELETYRDGLLWAGHKTFRHYCEAKWGYAKSHTYRLIAAGKLLQQLEQQIATLPDADGDATTALPVSECQIRPLLTLPSDKRAEAWVEAAKGGDVARLTGAQVARAAKRFRAVKENTGVVEVAAAEIPPPAASEILTELEGRLATHPNYAQISEHIGTIRELMREAA